MLEKACEVLNLGKYVTSEIINGGLTNTVYKVTTDKNVYAIKILNKDRIEKKVTSLEQIENSELIANIAFENGVNAVCALKINNKFIQEIDGDYILIFNWINGKIKLTKDLSLNNIEDIARNQALLHSIDINKSITNYTYNNFEKYYNIIKGDERSSIKKFIINYEYILKIYNQAYNNYLKLNDKLTITHRDLNRKNILWDNDIPYIIDFETARIGEPSIDFFNSIWFLSNDVEEEKFKVYSSTYLKIKKININNGVYAGIIEECDWLYYSLSRLFNEDENEQKLGIDSIENSINEIINYYEKIPKMLELLNSVIE